MNGARVLLSWIGCAHRDPGFQCGNLFRAEMLLRRHLRVATPFYCGDDRAVSRIARDQNRAVLTAAPHVLAVVHPQPALGFALRRRVAFEAVVREQRTDFVFEEGELFGGGFGVVSVGGRGKRKRDNARGELNGLHDDGSRDDILDHFPRHIREPEIAAVIVVGEPLVIEAEQR